MPTVQDYLEARAPASYLSDAKLSTLKSMATLEVGDAYCTPDIKNKVIALLVCHWLALKSRGGDGNVNGVGGNIISEKEGQLSKTMGKSDSILENNPDLSQTSWGLEILRMRNECFILPTNRRVR